jgi:Holliday junction resolvase RusA-like endonuclease
MYGLRAEMCVILFKVCFINIKHYIWQMNDHVRINITPQTFVRSTQGDRIYFRIPRDKLRPTGLARLKRLERYNQYKIDLLALCKSKGFKLPSQGLCINYFIPVPKSWSEKKKRLYHGTLHQSTPDIDNLLKATFDSLVSEDKYIGHLGSIMKRWVNFPTGWIEFEIIEPVLKEIGINSIMPMKD